MTRALLTAAVAAAALVALVPADAAEHLDFAAVARNVLPPGRSGSLTFPPTARDQLALYDGLTPKHGEVSAATSSASSSRRGSAPTGASCGPCGRAPGSRSGATGGTFRTSRAKPGATSCSAPAGRPPRTAGC